MQYCLLDLLSRLPVEFSMFNFILFCNSDTWKVSIHFKTFIDIHLMSIDVPLLCSTKRRRDVLTWSLPFFPVSLICFSNYNWELGCWEEERFLMREYKSGWLWYVDVDFVKTVNVVHRSDWSMEIYLLFIRHVIE